MDNPFLKRATDFVRDEEAFVAMVSPEPIRYFLAKRGQDGLLYDRLIIIRGTPGSGKTTLARLFDYPAMTALLRNTSITGYKQTLATLVDCGAIKDDSPIIVGCRLPMEVDYRDFWDFPYSEELRLGLMMALIQARAILTWLRNLTGAGHDLANIEVVPRKDAEASLDFIGGTNCQSVLAKAKAVEAAVYRTIGALVAPLESELETESTSAYRPFDVIEHFAVKGNPDTSTINLLPLVILDDAQVLHPIQYRALQRWLARRELRIARWLLTRLDVLHPQEALTAVTEGSSQPPDLPGITSSRDYVEIVLQSSPDDRRGQRIAFRKMAKDMASRYLRQMPLFSGRNLTALSDLLLTQAEPIATSKRTELEVHLETTRKRLAVSEARFKSIKEEADKYQSADEQIHADVRLAMTAVLLHRYAKRTPARSLFDDSSADIEPSKPLTADISVFDAAKLHLLHKYDRPFYCGIDDVCDASSENAEQFLRLAAALVNTAATQIIKAKAPSLDAKTQQRLLKGTAEEVIKAWDFPESERVKVLVTKISAMCLKVSLEGNAPLGPGANAYGILQKDFEAVVKDFPALARVLQFAVAYNAISLVPHYPCKKQEWCLLELGGMVILKHGLTLKRGGFIEGDSRQLSQLLEAAGDD
ncbi:MAG TPA: hypothetical protein VGO67_00820 [Verrucomicrobiae bacterium]|jgi:hypothetical protein